MLQLYPNAKINIGLHVTERRADGYHNLETFFYPIGLADQLAVTRQYDTESYQFYAKGISIDGSLDDNLILKTYRLFQREFGIGGVRIHFTKCIPFGAGLGGGSADAAFMAKVLNELFDLRQTPEQLMQLVGGLGADCPFFILNAPRYATGIGNEFSATSLSLSGYYLLLVKPQVHVSTVQAYRGVVPRKPDSSLRQLVETTPLEEWRGVVVNDFETTVFKQFPEIAAVKHQLYELGALYAAMSGSGSSVFGLFKECPQAVSGLFDHCFVHQELLR